MNLVSIIAVNCNTKDFAKLMISSVYRYTRTPYEIIIVDNASRDSSLEYLKEEKRIRFFKFDRNVGHGRGLDYATRESQGKYVIALDIDSHVLNYGWDVDLINLYVSDPRTKLVAAKGTENMKQEKYTDKPIRPCVMIFEKDFIFQNGISFSSVSGIYDTALYAFKIITDWKYRVERIPMGEKFYPDAYGDTYCIGKKPIVYHHWYGGRIYGKQEVDDVTIEEWQRRKDILFSQPHVKELMKNA